MIATISTAYSAVEPSEFAAYALDSDDVGFATRVMIGQYREGVRAALRGARVHAHEPVHRQRGYVDTLVAIVYNGMCSCGPEEDGQCVTCRLDMAINRNNTEVPY